MNHKGVPYVFGIELRPDETVGIKDGSNAFIVSEDQIESTGKETLAALLRLAEHAAHKSGGY